MRILILSRRASIYSTRRLADAARSRKHEVTVVDPLEFSLVVTRGRPSLYLRGAEVEGFDLVVPRIGASITQYGLAVVNQFDMMEVPVVNNSVPIARARDKLRALQLLARFDLDVPRTLITRRGEDLNGEAAGYRVLVAGVTRVGKRGVAEQRHIAAVANVVAVDHVAAHRHGDRG